MIFLILQLEVLIDQDLFLYNKIISENIDNKFAELVSPINRACLYVNQIKDDHELECLSTICFLIEEASSLSSEQILIKFKQWSQEKALKFTDKEILSGIYKLNDTNIIEKNLIGFSLVRSQK